jgi:hypothetical protein
VYSLLTALTDSRPYERPANIQNGFCEQYSTEAVQMGLAELWQTIRQTAFSVNADEQGHP